MFPTDAAAIAQASADRNLAGMLDAFWVNAAGEGLDVAEQRLRKGITAMRQTKRLLTQVLTEELAK
jgi:hypothetical protein